MQLIASLGTIAGLEGTFLGIAAMDNEGRELVYHNLMRGGKRVSKGDWGGADGDEGEGGRRGEVEEDIRAC